MASASRDRGLFASAAAVVAAWAGFTVLSIAHFFISATGASRVELGDLAIHVALFYLCWAIETPLVVLAARHLGAGFPRRPARAWWRLAAFGVGAMLLHGALYLSALWFWRIDAAARLDFAHLQGYLLRHAGGDLATFGAVIGGVLFLDARRLAHERERAAALVEGRLARAEVELLRWQLQPHFLFNTLNTVSTLVLKGETEAAEQAIELIARWLRAALERRADSLVTLGDELATTRQYVAIEALRFGDALRLDVRSEGDALDACVPALIVQPLVENAIRHGGVGVDGRHPITITAARRGGRVRVAVRNSRRRAERQAPASGWLAEREGFGLRYVREHLVQIYGDAATLEVATHDEHVTVTLDLPDHGGQPSRSGRDGTPSAAA